MERLYKRFLMIIILPVIIAAFPFLMYANADSDKAYDWYFKPTTDNSQPEVIPEADFLDDYNVIYLGNKDEKTLYLTFDAGYDNGYHTEILDTLKQKNVKAAFFVDGNFVKTNPEIVKRMANEGHLVCNHTASHKDMTKCKSFEEFKAELENMENIYREATGNTMARYYRPPEGKFDEANMKYAKQLGYKTVFWSFAYADWDNGKQMSLGEAKQKILSNIHNGEVMLLHPTSATNAAILGDVIRELKAQGYRFGTLDELCAP